MSGPVGAVPAATPNTVLILDPTVTGGASSLEAAQAMANGFDVEVVSGGTWRGMTQADFASYRAVILGDPTCVVGTVPVADAEASVAAWGPAINGNVIIIGGIPCR